MVKYSYPKWLPQTFRIVPKIQEQVSIRNSTVTMVKEKADERDDILAAHANLLQEGTSDVAWIAKISAGAKGTDYTYSVTSTCRPKL